MRGIRVGSGTCASSAWRTIGARVPSMSRRIALRPGSARSGSRAVASEGADDTPLVWRPAPPPDPQVHPHARLAPRPRLRVETPAQGRHVAPGDGDLLAVAHHEHRG